MSVGSLSLTNGSASVVGTGTTFTTDLSSGDFILFVIGGTTYTYPVLSIQSDTALTLVDDFDGPTTSTVSYSAVPSGEMVSVPMELIYQSTRAIRGLNLDKENWQQVYSSADQITVNLPDGSTFTGPSWLEVSRGIDATNLDAANAIADRMDASAATSQQAADSAAASETAAAQSATDAETSEQNAAVSANQAASSASNIADSVSQAAQSASDAAASATAAATSETNAATSETNAANSATAAAGSEQSVADNAAAAATSETNAANSATAAAGSAANASTSETNAATSESNAADSATSAANDAQTATDSIQQTLTNVQDAQTQADRATTEADRATTEADKLGNTNDFAAILDTIDIDNADVTFKGNVAGADAVDNNDFVTLSQLTLATEQQPLNADTFADLATLVPAEEGHLALLREYNSGTGQGGGTFIAVAGAGTSDLGMTQSVNDDFHWVRYIDPAKADVTMFGAVADGTTDCADAVTAMFNWYTGSGNIFQRIGIQFPAGEFAISSMPASTTQIPMFRCVGLGHDQLGYNNATRLWLIGDADSICFDVVARWTEIGNFQIQGDGLAGDTVVRHFFRNSVTQGQHVRVFNMYIQDVYGRMFQLIDSLDSKFSQVYAQRGHDNLIRVLASGELSWDHSTAIEISNSTIQSFVGTSDQDGVFFIPHCTQAMMWNVWIEFCDYPGNLTNGEWALHSLAMESNTNPLYMGQTRLAQYSCSNANGAGIDITTDKSVNNITGEPETNTLSSYEAGQVSIYSHGIYANASLQESLHYTGKMYSNSGSGSAVWINVGYFVGAATAETYRIHFVTRNGFATPSSSNGGLEGDCVVTIQNRGATTNTVTWHGQRGTSGILAVRYEKPFTSDTRLYVQLAGFSRMGVRVTSTGTTRLDAGVHSYVNWTMTEISSDDLSAITDLQTPISVNTWGTTTAGIIADGDNTLLDFYTTQVTENSTTKIAVKVNGTEGRIPFTTGNFLNIGHWRVADLLAASATLGDITSVNTFTDQTGTSLVEQVVYYDGTRWISLDGQHVVISDGTTSPVSS